MAANGAATRAIAPSSGWLAEPRFERDTCLVEGAWARGIQRDCGWLVVPESREAPKSNFVRLAVEVIRAKEPDGTPPLVFVHGGPGGQGGIRLFSAGVAASPIALHRDVVIYDQRGAGLSQPKLCPAYDRLFESTVNHPEARDKNRTLDAARRACVQQLDAQHIDRAAYSTDASAADLIDLRHALGYARWDIYAPSYGALLAQEVMERDVAGIRAVVLASPVGRAIMQKAEQPQSTQHAFERVFDACRVQPACRAAFPQPADDFYAVYDALNRSPIHVATAGSARREDGVVLDGEGLVANVRNRLLNRAGISRVPLLLHELHRGDRLRAAREVVGDGTMPSNAGDAALREIVLCNDGQTSGSAYRKAAKSANAASRPPFRRAADRDERECGGWIPRIVDRPARLPVRSDIPTLILTGYFDDRTPSEHGRRMAASLSRAYVVELPDEGHDARPGACHAAIVQQFYEDPTRAPDTTCIAHIPSIQFATSWNAALGRH
jgi:pimeloyl-ACP methyl ester carboxylesterase